MGYHVSIDESSQILMKLVSVEPSKVFSRAYSAYLVFLVTQYDRQQLDWLVANAPSLDSLTGRHLAFAIFAKNFPVKIRTGATRDVVEAEIGGQASALLSHRIPAEALMKPSRVTRLVENGVFGVVLDGDELTAITYGTDMVASELGVLDKLPCLVVLDSVPAASPLVVPLTPKLLPELVQRLRSAISRFYAIDGQTAMLDDANRLLSIQARLDAERSRDATLRKRISEEKAKLLKLKQKVDANVVTRDPNFYAGLVLSRESVLATLESELREFKYTHSERTTSIEAELSAAMAAHRAHQHQAFSQCFAAELRSAGLMESVNAAKAQSMNFISALFKPELLLKIWKFVQ